MTICKQGWRRRKLEGSTLADSGIPQHGPSRALKSTQVVLRSKDWSIRLVTVKLFAAVFALEFFHHRFLGFLLMEAKQEGRSILFVTICCPASAGVSSVVTVVNAPHQRDCRPLAVTRGVKGGRRIPAICLGAEQLGEFITCLRRAPAVMTGHGCCGFDSNVEAMLF